MLHFIEYVDKHIRVKLPKSLRQQRSKLLFRGNLVRGNSNTRVSVAIIPDIHEVLTDEFLNPKEVEFKGTLEGHTLLSYGPCEFGDGGREAFTATEIYDKGYTLYSFETVFRLEGRYVMFSIMGGGTREEFERMAKEIITSFRFQPTETHAIAPASPVSIKNDKCGGMRAKDKARLEKSLDSLPVEIEYLRAPILALADEDQNMLGTGEVDSNLLAELIETQAATLGPDFASSHAEILDQWADEHKLREKTWASPVWFTQAFLIGFSAFGNQ